MKVRCAARLECRSVWQDGELDCATWMPRFVSFTRKQRTRSSSVLRYLAEKPNQTYNSVANSWSKKFSISRAHRTLSNAPHNGSSPPQNHYVPRHINNRYIKSYNQCTDFPPNKGFKVMSSRSGVPWQSSLRSSLQYCVGTALGCREVASGKCFC